MKMIDIIKLRIIMRLLYCLVNNEWLGSFFQIFWKYTEYDTIIIKITFYY